MSRHRSKATNRRTRFHGIARDAQCCSTVSSSVRTAVCPWGISSTILSNSIRIKCRMESEPESRRHSPDAYERVDLGEEDRCPAERVPGDGGGFNAGADTAVSHRSLVPCLRGCSWRESLVEAEASDDWRFCRVSSERRVVSLSRRAPGRRFATACGRRHSVAATRSHPRLVCGVGASHRAGVEVSRMRLRKRYDRLLPAA